jgi:hypothetical protein
MVVALLLTALLLLTAGHREAQRELNGPAVPLRAWYQRVMQAGKAATEALR